MRTPRLLLAVAVAVALLAACVNRVGPSVARLPANSPVSGECGAADVLVRGGADEEPSITVPRRCAPPTTLLARDVTVGDGRQAVVGSTLTVNYVLYAWSSGVQVDSTWAGRDEMAFKVTDLGRAEVVQGWNEGLPGIREGGRRLLVVPAPTAADDSDDFAGDATLVYVVDAVRVTE